MAAEGEMRGVMQSWRFRQKLSCRFAIGVSAALIGPAIVPAGASAAALTVNTLADSAATPSACQGVPSDCSLRQALDKAAPGDTITFSVTGTLSLDPGNGPLQDNTDVIINGPGASQLTIDGGGMQILHVGGAPGLSVSGLTFRNGRATSSGSSVAEGGAILFTGIGNYILSADAFVNDTAQGSSVGDQGGAIAADPATFSGENASLSVNSSSFTGDSSSFTGSTSNRPEVLGGAIYASGGPLSIDGSTFTGDSVAVSVFGEAAGGAVYTTFGDAVSISNSTFTGNSASGPPSPSGNGDGGALALSSSGTTLTDDTIDGNVATNSGGGIFQAGGVIAYGTIIWGNKLELGGGVESGEQCFGSFANAASTTSYNLEGPTGHTCLAPGPTVADVMLGPLADNGGPTQTQAITPSSSAYGGVPAAVCRSAPFLRVDQRGLPRPGTGEMNCDIGAYEYQASNTTTSLASSENPSTAGGQVTFTATVSPTPNGGTVAVTDGGTTISGCTMVPVSGTGQASCQVTYPAAGSHSIAVSYSGDPAFASSGSPTLDQVVQPVPPSGGGGSSGSGGGGGSAKSGGSGGSGGGAGPHASVGKVTVIGQHVTASITCHGAVGTSCAMKLSLAVSVSGGKVTAAAALSHKRGTRTVIVGTTRVVRVRAGRTEKITASLNRAGRKLLEKYEQLRATLAIGQLKDGRSRTIFTRTVTFKQTEEQEEVAGLARGTKAKPQ
jgi:hypothetical protein